MGPQILIVIPTFQKRIQTSNVLDRLLRSLTILPRERFRVVVLNTTLPVSREIVQKVDQIIRPYKNLFKIIQISAFDLSIIYRFLQQNERTFFKNYITMEGYPNFRNIGLIIGNILEADILIFLDDDVIVKDNRLIDKIQKDIGGIITGRFIGGIAGYYVEGNSNSYFISDKKSKKWWKILWNKEKYINKLIMENMSSKSNLDKSYFVLGGIMALHKKLYRCVPFDPWIKRGECIEYSLCANYFGFEILVDKELFVVHDKPDRSTELYWEKMRKDIFRFLYMKKKIQKLNVHPQELYPYPGVFLKSNLEFRIFLTSVLLGLDYLSKLKFKDFVESLKNIKISLLEARRYAKAHYEDFFKFQKQWMAIMADLSKDGEVKKYFKEKFKS